MAESKEDHYYEVFIVPIMKGKETYGEKYLGPADDLTSQSNCTDTGD